MKEINKKMIDVGPGVENELNITRNMLETSLYLLERKGYNVYSGRVPQLTNANQATTQKVLCAPGLKHKDIYNYAEVGTLTDYISRDGGNSYEKKFTYPSSMDSKRLKIRYADEVGADGFKGVEKDGIVEIRRGVPDLSLGESRYSQVRILVDGTHYIKGMAVYSDKMPDGVDVIFNTNKSSNKSKMECLKEIKKYEDNPFGSTIKDADQGGQYWYDPKTGKRLAYGDTSVKDKKLGLINKRADEGDWTEWKDKLPSQFLSKQSLQLAQKQLNLSKANKRDEYEEIMSLNNPTLRKYYLDKFASSCDADAKDLKAAALPGQKYHVIVPVNNLSDKEIYAPQYKPGTKLALIRYPHAGTFEIPILTVTDKNQLARKIIGNSSIDAVGINKKVADRLSGADFDGDTVMCIPTHDRSGKVKIANRNYLPGLEGFDNKLEYGPDPDKKPYTDKNGKTHYFHNGREYIPLAKSRVGIEMGEISNLINDMTLGGASDSEVTRAVKHSMVVIDAEKHKLDYRQSEKDNGINELKKKYQPKFNENGDVIGGGGTSTIISRAKGIHNVPKRKGEPRVNIKGKDYYDPTKPEGALLYKTAPDKDLYYVKQNYNKSTGTYTLVTTNGKKITYNPNDTDQARKYNPVMGYDKKTGKVVFTNKDRTISYRYEQRQDRSTNMDETSDAYTLVSSNKYPMEMLYADYANSMKALANEARKSSAYTPRLKYSTDAAKVYAKEVSELNANLNEAKKNAVKERTVLRLANVDMNNKKSIDPDMTNGEYRKQSQRSISKYRDEVGAVSRKKRSIKITDKQWEAIQAGAISDNKLKQILNYSDPDVLREKAMPKQKTTFTNSQIARMKALSNSNFTLQQIAEKMNCSTATVSKYLKGAI